MVSFSKHAQVTFVENMHVKIIVHFSIIINRINRIDLTATIPDVSIPFESPCLLCRIGLPNILLPVLENRLNNDPLEDCFLNINRNNKNIAIAKYGNITIAIDKYD